MIKMNFIFLLLSAWFACDESPAQLQDFKESIKRGAVVYEDFCMNCHMPKGEGEPGVYPPLAAADYLMDKRQESIRAVKYGLSGEIVVNGKIYNNSMVSLGLTDDEVADVMNYILNSWGNDDGKMVTASEVSKIEP